MTGTARPEYAAAKSAAKFDATEINKNYHKKL
jgi:hypothetical protein